MGKDEQGSKAKLCWLGREKIQGSRIPLDNVPADCSRYIFDYKTYSDVHNWQ
jgi:hypothetical protein